VLYCILQLCTVTSTLRWAILTVLWLGFCLTRPISLCSFLTHKNPSLIWPIVCLVELNFNCWVLSGRTSINAVIVVWHFPQTNDFRSFTRWASLLSPRSWRQKDDNWFSMGVWHFIQGETQTLTITMCSMISHPNSLIPDLGKVLIYWTRKWVDSIVTLQCGSVEWQSTPIELVATI